MNFQKPRLSSVLMMSRISAIIFIAVFFIGAIIFQYSTEKAIAAGTMDIVVSDSPDPFYPQDESNIVVINNIGTIPCKLTLSIENTERSWVEENLISGGSIQKIWDGKDSKGNFVPAGIYNYTAICEQQLIALSTFDKIYSFIIPTALAYFSDTETGTITVVSQPYYSIL